MIRPGSPGGKALEGMEKCPHSPLPLGEYRGAKRADRLASADAWLHLGWEGAGSANRQNPELQRKNIGYALGSLRTAASLGCSRFLFTGSQAEYGICRGPMGEDQECRPVSEYGKDKLEVCRQAGELAAQLGISYIHARVFSVYGPGDHPWSLVFHLRGHLPPGRPYGDGALYPAVEFPLCGGGSQDFGGNFSLAKSPAACIMWRGEDTRPLKSYMEELYRLCGSRGSYEFGSRGPNAEGQISLEPDIAKLKKRPGLLPGDLLCGGDPPDAWARGAHGQEGDRGMKRCIACGAPLWETPLLTLDNMPASAQAHAGRGTGKAGSGAHPGSVPMHGLRPGAV